MYTIEKCLSFTLVPLKKGSFGEKSFNFKGRSYDVTYNSNFSYKHFAMIDCITHYLRSTVFNELYKKSDNDKPPFRPGDPRIIDKMKMFGPFTDKDFIKSLYINDDMIRSHPMFRSWRNGWEIFNFLKETSKIEFEKLRYYYVCYDIQDNRFMYKPLPIIEKCNLFDVSLSKKKYKCNLYKIDFNSLLAKAFAYNVNVANIHLVQDDFYKLDGIGQSIYRFFILFNNDKIVIDFDDICKILEYNKSKENKNNIIKGISNRLDNMKDLSLIKQWKLRYDIFEINR